MIAKYILLGVSLAAPIGPVSIEIIKRGLKRGFWASFTLSLGAALGDSFYLVLSFFGLAPLVVHPVARIVIGSLGSLVLCYLGYQSIMGALKGDLWDDGEECKNSNAIILGFTLAVANPMSIIWWVGTFGAVLSGEEVSSLDWTYLLQSSAIILGVMIWATALCALLGFGRRFFRPWMIQVAGGLAGAFLLGYGLKLAWDTSSLFFA